MPTVSYTQEEIKSLQSSFIAKVYGWMALALVITALAALTVVTSEEMTKAIIGNRIVFFGLILGELGLVMYLSAAINRISAGIATLLFVLYSLLNGFTLSVIFMAYTSGSIASTFLVTAGTFGIMSLYGYTTKRDLTSWGNLLFMALIGLVIASLVNLFWQNSILYWISTYAGILIFVGLTAYDTQKLKEMGAAGFESEDGVQKGTIMGALILYLDFINLFLLLLRLFGRRR